MIHARREAICSSDNSGGVLGPRGVAEDAAGRSWAFIRCVVVWVEAGAREDTGYVGFIRLSACWGCTSGASIRLRSTPRVVMAQKLCRILRNT